MYQEVRMWMYRNAREIELNLWKYFFEDGSKDAVVSALMFYQNEDGGFGHALEADNWNPNSTPYTTYVAINILKSIGFTDMKHPIYQGIMKYLVSGKDKKEYGWCFSVPSNNDFVHAPWWTYDEEGNKIESIGLSAELGAFILKYGDKNSEVYKEVTKLVKVLIDKMMVENKLGAMGVGGYITLVETMKELDLSNYNFILIQNRLNELVKNVLEKDAADWSVYGTFPSDYIKSPTSIYYEENKELVQKELSYLIETKPKDDMWGITWNWFNLMERYPKEFILSENWWKAMKAIEKVNFLKNFEAISISITK